jgi:hypothetical protein
MGADKHHFGLARLVHQGPLGRIFASFFASQNGSPVVTCKTYDEAIEMLAESTPNILVNALGSPISGERA